MRVAEVRVVRAGFADVLGAMREWLDRNDRPLAHFETEANDVGLITIKVRFDSDDLAELFRQAFGGTFGVDRRTAARQENPRRSFAMMRWLSPGIAARMPPRNRPMDAIPDLDDT